LIDHDPLLLAGIANWAGIEAPVYRAGRRCFSRGVSFARIMERKMNEVDAFRTHIGHLNHAVATTTCRKTVDMLRQMLEETKAKLCQINARPPAHNPTGHSHLPG
jgi:hypothetical protein